MKNRKNEKKIFITILFVLSAFLCCCSNHISDITSGTQPQPVIPIIPESGDPTPEPATPEPTPTPPETPVPTPPAPATFSVTCTSGEHGSITVDNTTAAAGTNITITVTPESGYMLDALTVTDSSGNQIIITQRTFVMPDCNVIVYATFETIGTITMKTGSDINTILKNDLNANTVALKFLHSETLPTGVTTFTLSQDSSEVPVYAWLDETIIYFYAEGYTDYQNSINRIPLNPNSSGLFSFCENLEEIDLSYFDTSEVTDMSTMFFNCANLTSLDVSHFDTLKVTDMKNMFSQCGAIEELNVSNFNTSNVTSMYFMFSHCYALKSLDLSNFNTAKVTNMKGMFYSCNELETLDISNFDTSEVTDMTHQYTLGTNLLSFGMFSYCEKLKTLDLSSFDTSKITNMTEMFYRCSELKTIKASDSFVTTGVTESEDMFAFCSKLKGGAGTSYTYSNPRNKTYARIDGGPNSPGYFTSGN